MGLSLAGLARLGAGFDAGEFGLRFGVRFGAMGFEIWRGAGSALAVGLVVLVAGLRELAAGASAGLFSIACTPFFDALEVVEENRQGNQES